MASGDETLKFLGIHALSNSANETTVTSGHTYTVISVTFCEMGDATELISMYVDDASNDIYVLNAQELPAKSTFVWNDKLVLEAADKLGFITASAANVDVAISYLDQEL
jgi:hypothetical protein